MKNLIKMPAKQAIKSYNNSLKKGEKAFSLSTFYPKHSFLPHCLSLFATVNLVRNANNKVSMLDTMNAIKDQHITTEGIIPRDQLSDLVLLVYNVPRNYLMNVSAKKDPTMGAFTPIFMYAHKLYNNVSYTEWDKDDVAIDYALGKTLGKMFLYAKTNEKPVIDSPSELRADAMTYKSGKRQGKQEELESYKMTPGDRSIPMDILRQELQTWIANVNLREPEVMILDMWDWGRTPDALDIKIPVTPEVVEEENTTPWL